MNVPIKANRQLMSFRYGDQQIAFERVKRPQATSKVLIKVHPDCRVVVSAPEDADNEMVLNAVKKRSRWIYEKLRNFRKQLEHITPRQYISGESHYYLGKQYLLKVIEAPEQAQGVKLLRGKLEVSVKIKSAEKVKTLLADWYKARAKEIFAKRLDAMLEQALWVTDGPPLRILTMQTQWGSCSPNGRITLNPHLVKAPRECIDYVILHELCHIAEHNHSERFYRLMSKVMPKWEKTKERLDGMASSITS
ncbi:metal-dependent hydrolase [Thalassolituus oleivorans]|jgi:predicted metal-dependent hydrolase|uniref:M48 family metallopeptidase n=1 Tax=Thalassolituus oleivorans TaxID=187493 RepID=UPI00094923AB|nr:SprT family zinc-dependent metalloprotease [Thalassolituus oleivorans]APR67821.1 metal-dependent hydrolase [Thalassolituus oleivorans]